MAVTSRATDRSGVRAVDLKQLRYFDTVAQTCHFSQAAERLHLAQPALSQAIRRLENELGVTLFARTTRQVSLTPAGVFFHREVQRILADLETAAAGTRAIAEGSRGVLRVGFTGTSAFTQLPRFSHLMQAALPDVVLEIQADLLTPDQTERLLDGRLDLGILRGPLADGAIATRRLLAEPMVLALPATHRLAEATGPDGPRLAMADLAGEEFVAYDNTRSAVNEALVASCLQAGFAPRVAHRAPGTSALLALVTARLGIALVPESVRAMQLDGVVFRDVAGATSIDLSLAWRADEPAPLVVSALDVLSRHDFFSPAALPAASTQRGPA